MTDKKLQHGILRLATEVVRFGQSPVRDLLASVLELEISRLNLEVFAEHLEAEDNEHWQRTIVKWTELAKDYASKL